MKKLITIKQVGLLPIGATLYEKPEAADHLIERGYAELHPEQDPEPAEIERVLYKDEDGAWRTKDVVKGVAEAQPETTEHKQPKVKK